MDFPFDLAELLVYAAMGAACGVLGAAFVYLHKRIVLFNRKHKRMSAFLQRNRFLYPLIITTLISTVTFPPFLGKYMASEVSAGCLTGQTTSGVFLFLVLGNVH